MLLDDGKLYDPAICGCNPQEGLVAVEHVERRGAPDAVILYSRQGTGTKAQSEPFAPFIVASAAALNGCPVKFRAVALKGQGLLNVCAHFESWHDCGKAKDWLVKQTGLPPSDRLAPYLWLNDPIQQYLTLSGRALFRGLAFEDVRRMQVDIECFTSEGYEFCNAEREGDRIVAIGLGDQTGWIETLDGSALTEKALLERFVEIVRERDPDVIEGHNIFNFDLPYIRTRASRCGVKLALGRDGSVPSWRPSRFSVGERTVAYERCDIHGRHVVDTLFLVHAYDIAHRSLNGFGLKEVAVHFGLAAQDRTYVQGSAIGAEFQRDPAKILRYLRDDVAETRALSNLLSRSSFIQARMLPYSYQNVCVRGTATKIDALLIREYLRQGMALPLPDAPRQFEGGYTDMFVQGVVKGVHHCDVRSLYPSLMLSRTLGPARDELGVFLKLLDTLRTFRLQAKAQLAKSKSEQERNYLDALQTTFKVLINSFYGYLGFAQARFSDFAAAEEVTRQGRLLLTDMIERLRAQGATPVEIDTDGIYFVPPPGLTGRTLEAFRKKFAEALPDGIEVEFDGEYVAMYSYKMKNYALLEADGEVVIKGAALKSRGLEPFQRDFLRDLIRLKLEGEDAGIPALKERYASAIGGRQWPIEQFAKTERLQDAPATYAAKMAKQKRAKDAAYELALRSNRAYRAGDQLSYYVTGAKKSVPVHQNAKLVSDWDPRNRDENVAYYLAKLDALYQKFGAEGAQSELDFGGPAATEE
jgi:DNA polymerase elongation subunit (family B)